MMNDTESDWGDASVSVTVMVTRNRPSLRGGARDHAAAEGQPGCQGPVCDQLYGPLPPEGVSDRVNGSPTWVSWVPGLVIVSVGYAHATLAFASALCADGDVTTSVSVICHWFDAAVTESGTLTDPPAATSTCAGPVLVPSERAQ